MAWAPHPGRVYHFPTISGKIHLLKNAVVAQVGKNSLQKEIFCSPQQKVTILNPTDKYLGLNLVVVGMAFVNINSTALIFL